MAHPTLQEVLDRLSGVKQSGTSTYTALCPAHDDHNPSLSLTEKYGKVLLHCHTGCTYKVIMAALGFPKNAQTPATGTGTTPLGDIVNVYDYHDADGHLLHQTIRYEPKDFRQRRPDSANPGGYLWTLKGITPVLYRLPEVLQAVKVGSTILDGSLILV